MALKKLPQSERLLSGTLSAPLDASATTVDVSTPPEATKLPTYFEIDPDGDTPETVKVTGVSSNTITIVRGVYTGGTGVPHLSNAPYKQKITTKHWSAVVDALESGYLTEDPTYTLTRTDADTLRVDGVDFTAFYTAGRILRLSGTNIVRVISSSFSGGNTVIEVVGTVPDPLTSVELAIQPLGANDLVAFLAGAQTFTGAKTFGDALLIATSPKITTGIKDANGNEAIKIPATTSAVNELTIRNAATTDNPSIEATGDDTDIGILLKPKGAGVIVHDGAENYAADTEASDTYAILVEGVAAYKTGQIFRFKANTANTGAATLNVNAIGAKTIKKLHDQDLETGDIESGQMVEVIYDGTNLQMISQLGQSSTTPIGYDGWTLTSYTWVYASASTFTIAGVDLTGLFRKGVKIKFTQSAAVKYGVVVSSSFSTNTTVTIAVNTDYTIANAAISDAYFSYQSNPIGFPTRFNFTPVWTNLTVGSGTIPYAFYSVQGDRVTFKVKFIFGSGSSISGAIYMTAPVAFTTITGIADQDPLPGAVLMLDTGTALYTGGMQYDITNGKIEARPFDASVTYAKFVAASSTVPMTWTTNDSLSMDGSYQI